MIYLKYFENFINEDNNFIYIKDVEKEYDYFHISTTKLDEMFTFTARVPNMPYKDSNNCVIEDDFTKRISLAKNIQNCLDAITDEDVDGYYVYGVKENDYDIQKILDISKSSCPLNYGIDFNLTEWLCDNGIDDEYNIPSELPEYLKKQFYGCVPDVNETGEFWYLSDLTMRYIGEVIPWKYGIEKILI